MMITNVSAEAVAEGGSKSNGEDVKKLINDLYTENFIEEASNSFIAKYFGFNLSDLDESSDSDSDVYFLGDEETDYQNTGKQSRSSSSSSGGSGETKNQQRIIRMEEP